MCNVNLTLFGYKLNLRITRPTAPPALPNVLDLLRDWHNALIKDAEKSVDRQTRLLALSASIFHVYNAIMDMMPKNANGSSQTNYLLHHQLAYSYYVSQTLGIRKLVDPSSDVFSMRAIVKDMKVNRGLLTRAAILTWDEINYDNLNLREVDREDRRDERNIFIDIITMKTHATRSQEDTIADELWTTLEAWLNKCDEIRLHVNQFVAHSVDPNHYKAMTPAVLRPTYRQLEIGQEYIYRLYSFMAYFISGFLNGGLVDANPLLGSEFLDVPAVNTAQIPAVEQTWQDYCNGIAAIVNTNWTTTFPQL
jgi:hypothetical protein